MTNFEAPNQAIIPVAGYGTRRLPISKAIEKCMLPIGNRPLVDFVVDDCIAAGAREIIFVVGEDSTQLETYYGRNLALEKHLKAKGKTGELEQILAISGKAEFDYVRQPQTEEAPYGTAVPVALCADRVSESDTVLVAMGDDFVYNPDGSSDLKRLVEAVQASGAYVGMLAALVPQPEVEKYGVLKTRGLEPALFLEEIIEKPSPEEAPGRLVNISKHLFNKAMVGMAATMVEGEKPKGSEYVIVDVITEYARTHPLLVLPVRGKYLDGGTDEGALEATKFIANSQNLRDVIR